MRFIVCVVHTNIIQAHFFTRINSEDAKYYLSKVKSTVAEAENMDNQISQESNGSIDQDVINIGVTNSDEIFFDGIGTDSAKQSSDSIDECHQSPKRMRLADQSNEISSSMPSSCLSIALSEKLKNDIEGVKEVIESHSVEELIMAFDDLRNNHPELLYKTRRQFCEFFSRNGCKQQLMEMVKLHYDACSNNKAIKFDFDCFIDALMATGMTYGDALRLILNEVKEYSVKMAKYVVKKLIDNRIGNINQFFRDLINLLDVVGFKYEAVEINRLMALVLANEYDGKAWNAVLQIVNKADVPQLNNDILETFCKYSAIKKKGRFLGISRKMFPEKGPNAHPKGL